MLLSIKYERFGEKFRTFYRDLVRGVRGVVRVYNMTGVLNSYFLNDWKIIIVHESAIIRNILM